MLMCGRREGADGIRVCSRRVHEGQLNFGFGNGDDISKMDLTCRY